MSASALVEHNLGISALNAKLGGCVGELEPHTGFVAEFAPEVRAGEANAAGGAHCGVIDGGCERRYWRRELLTATISCDDSRRR